MSAAEHLREAIAVGCTRDDHDHVGDHRAEVLAAGSALILAARDADEAQHPDDIAHINRRIGMREAAALLRREFEPAQPPSQRPQVRRAAGKDTGGAPAGESTQPALDVNRVVAYRSQGGRILRCLAHAPSDLTGFALVTSEDLPDGGICTLPDCGRDVLTPGNADDEVMRTVRRAIADFPFAMYGIDIDGPDPAWVGDLASAITGALGTPAAPAAEYAHWTAITTALNAAAAAGIHIGIDVNGDALTDLSDRAITYDSTEARWVVVCNDCDRTLQTCGHCRHCDTCDDCAECSGTGCTCRCEVPRG
jgi:hypothetical protein